MKSLRLLIMFASIVAIGACANTIQGAGRDAANTVDAAQGAASDVANATE